MNEFSENPNYLSAGWIAAYVVIGGIVYYLIYKAKKDQETAPSKTVCFVNEKGVNECYSQPLNKDQVQRLLQVRNAPNTSPELRSKIDDLLSGSSTARKDQSSLYGVDPAGFLL